jgi:O-antigen/teichoic acid export membrane protein
VPDLWRAVLIGPLRFIAPLIGYAIVYPLLLNSASLSVVGLWALLATIQSAALLADIGFTQTITLQLTRPEHSARRNAARAFFTVHLAFSALGLISATTLAALFAFFFGYRNGTYGLVGMATATALATVGAALQLKSRVDAAVLAAHDENAWVQFTTGWTSLLTYVPATLGVLLNYPLEGFGIGIALSGCTLYLLSTRRARRWIAHESAGNFGSTEWLRELGSLIKTGRHFYAIGAGLVIRVPISRFLLAAVAGLEAVGMFDIAMRVTQAIRDGIAVGFSALLPSFSRLTLQEDIEEIANLIKLSLLVLLPIGGLALGGLLVCGHAVVTTWLGQPPNDLWLCIKVLAVWQFITLVNVPYWFLLQASGNERLAALSIWLHTGLLVAAAALVPIDNAVDFSVYWTISAIATQLFIYASVEVKLKLLKRTMYLRPVIAAILLSVLTLGAGWLVDSFNGEPAKYWPTMLTFVGFAALLQWLFWRIGFLGIISGLRG